MLPLTSLNSIIKQETRENILPRPIGPFGWIGFYKAILNSPHKNKSQYICFYWTHESGYLDGQHV